MCNGGPCKSQEERLNVIRELANNINLDDFTTDQEKLMDVWAAIHFWPRVSAKVLFPHKMKGYVSTTVNIGHYASNKATAMRCRKEGNIKSALIYEQICERVYNNLPTWARW